jgi:hypothetical protein
MEISIRYNKVQIRSVALGEAFSNLTGDIIISKNGFVEVHTNIRFYTSLDCLPLSLLNLLAKELEELGIDNKLLLKVKRIIKK